MATIKFKEDSPYNRDLNSTYFTDQKYISYLEQKLALQDSQSEVKEISVVNIALFGVGNIGLVHMNNLLSSNQFRLKYIIDNDVEKLSNLKKDVRTRQCVFLTGQESDRVLADDDLRAVCVALPSCVHSDLVIRALRAKKAVICEKPIGKDEQEVLKCYEVAEETGQPLICAFNRRFDPTFSAVRTRVRAGELGELHRIKTVSRDSPMPSIDYIRISGGIFRDTIIHDVDIICHILGEYPTKVYTAASSFIKEIKELDDYDTVVATMEFDSGAIASIDVSRNSIYGYDQRMEVFGPKGMIIAHNEKPSQMTFSSKDGDKGFSIYYSAASRYEEAYIKELEHFYYVIQGSSKLLITKESTFKVTRIASCLEMSARNKTPVSVTYDDLQ